MSIENEYITVEQLSKITTLAPNTLAKYRAQGIGPDFIKINRKIFYKKSTVEKWFEANTFADNQAYLNKLDVEKWVEEYDRETWRNEVKSHQAHGATKLKALAKKQSELNHQIAIVEKMHGICFDEIDSSVVRRD